MRTQHWPEAAHESWNKLQINWWIQTSRNRQNKGSRRNMFTNTEILEAIEPEETERELMTQII